MVMRPAASQPPGGQWRIGGRRTTRQQLYMIRFPCCPGTSCRIFRLRNEALMSLPSAEQGTRVPVSVVCVFNNPAVLRECLTESVAAGLHEAADTEYLPVDNTTRQYSS